MKQQNNYTHAMALQRIIQSRYMTISIFLFNMLMVLIYIHDIAAAPENTLTDPLFLLVHLIMLAYYTTQVTFHRLHTPNDNSEPFH